MCMWCEGKERLKVVVILGICSFSVLWSHVHQHTYGLRGLHGRWWGKWQSLKGKLATKIIYVYIYSYHYAYHLYLNLFIFVSICILHSHYTHKLMETMVIRTSLEPLKFHYIREEAQEASAFPEDDWQLKWCLGGRARVTFFSGKVDKLTTLQ